MGHGLPCCESSATEHRSEPGSMRWTRELLRMSLWSPWPTSWHVLLGPYSPAATNTDPSPHNGAEKDACGFEALPRPPLTHQHDRLNFTHRSLHRSSKDERTVPTACLKSAKHNGLYGRSAYKNRHAAYLIMAR